MEPLFSIRVDVYTHAEDTGSNPLMTKIDAVLAAIQGLVEKEEHMAGELDQLEATVTAQTTVIASAITLLQGLKSALDAAIAAGDMSRVTAIAQQIEAQTQALANAVVANTPSEIV